MDFSVAVVGAGLAGLSAACRLAQAGVSVSVFDKGRGVAGRTATRHADAGRRFDHGAQYFTVGDPGFGERVATWRAEGVVAEWRGELATIVCDATGCHQTNPPRPKTRYVGTPGMNAMGRALAEEAKAAGVTVRSGVCVVAPQPASGGWRLVRDSGEALGLFDCVLVTAPAPQAAVLLAASTELAEAAAGVQMTGCWAAMVAFADRLPAGADGLFINGDAVATPLSWAARNGSKPGRPAAAEAGDCWVLHGSPAWSEANLDAKPARAAEQLIAGLGDALGRSLPGVLHSAAHRWRYALPSEPLPERFLADHALGLYAAGDWCGGPKVEGACLSGSAAAEAILASSPG